MDPEDEREADYKLGLWHDRMTLAVAICEEFSNKVEWKLIGYGTEHDGTRHVEPAIIVLLHQKWYSELEKRINQCGWRIITQVSFGQVHWLTLVDKFR